MATGVYFQSFAKAVGDKKINLSSDQLVVALVATANAPDAATDTQLSDLTQISYTNCSSRNVTTTSWSATGGNTDQVLVDLVLTASGGDVGPFQYVVLYDDTATNDDLIMYWDVGSATTITSGNNKTLNFSAYTVRFTTP